MDRVSQGPTKAGVVPKDTTLGTGNGGGRDLTHRMVVFPAASNPTINMRISFRPNMRSLNGGEND